MNDLRNKKHITVINTFSSEPDILASASQASKLVYLTTFLAGYICAVNFLPQLEPIHIVEK